MIFLFEYFTFSFRILFKKIVSIPLLRFPICSFIDIFFSSIFQQFVIAVKKSLPAKSNIWFTHSFCSPFSYMVHTLLFICTSSIFYLKIEHFNHSRAVVFFWGVLLYLLLFCFCPFLILNCGLPCSDCRQYLIPLYTVLVSHCCFLRLVPWSGLFCSYFFLGCQPRI